MRQKWHWEWIGYENFLCFITDCVTLLFLINQCSFLLFDPPFFLFEMAILLRYISLLGFILLLNNLSVAIVLCKEVFQFFRFGRGFSDTKRIQFADTDIMKKNQKKRTNSIHWIHLIVSVKARKSSRVWWYMWITRSIIVCLQGVFLAPPPLFYGNHPLSNKSSIRILACIMHYCFFF